MRKNILICVLVVFLSSCASTQGKGVNLSHEDEISIVGTWAMLPLRNGIANVVEFTDAGRSNLYPFNCRVGSSDPVESSRYRISGDGKRMRIFSPAGVQNFDVISVEDNSMKLGMSIGEFELTFSYVRVNQVSPLCFLYNEAVADGSKNSAFKEEDFVHDPWVPENPHVERYVGRWENEEGKVQVEVVRDGEARYKIYKESSENWNHLYNDVRWSGLELRYQHFAYSDKEELFEHAFHKSSRLAMLTPVDDLNKIKWSFFVGDKRYDYILNRR
ncbi:hypothetical protein EKK97_09610 [Billgrantia tianxiuensis]|uniref:Lipocalin-like domain-containing protein n=1 Tax=Billgrantia tianxiuensis TaxID=2497861 RepID=A0A6I6SKJ1_9GAMM|nr:MULTISPECIES: hypothetical protein [Halomonas]MCE8032168.1 hypothetical protein [Halomonas sp. MCCC 1A11057]QHC49811.1 hypothetical protein EKK97_09610 [Halomonas tianxiuensis]